MKRLIISVLSAIAITGMMAQPVDSTFTVDGSKGKLFTRVQLPDFDSGKKIPVVILCHGFGGNSGGPLFDSIAGDLVDDGIGVVRFDFNGHGRSEGDFQDMTVLNEIEDAKKIIEWVESQPFTESVSLLGHSQGGVVAAMTAGQAGQKRVKAAVLMAPAAVLRDDALRGNTMGAMYDPWNLPEYVQLFGNLRLGRGYIETARDLPIYEVASHYAGPVLVLHGTADRVVPYTYGERFAKEMPAAHIGIIQGDDHGFSQSVTETARRASSWLASMIK